MAAAPDDDCTTNRENHQHDVSDRRHLKRYHTEKKLTFCITLTDSVHIHVCMCLLYFDDLKACIKAVASLGGGGGGR